jgi:hypothetical protein
MSKLVKLKEWLTLDDAAKHLSIMFGEDVGVADVLRLALDYRLTLSINFVNEAYALVGSIKEASEARHVDFPADMAAASKAKTPGEYQGGWKKLCMGVRLVGSSKVIDLEREIVALRGVYDLPMIGGERLEVEDRFQQMTGGPAVTAVSMDGAFVSLGGGQFAQLQDHHDENPYMDSEKLKKPWRHEDNFYPGGGLPDDGVLVVRTGALEEFLESLVEEPTGSDAKADVSTRERSTLLKLVIGMAMEGYKYSPESARNGAVTEIAGDLAKHGLDVSDDTVRKYLREATKTVLTKSRRKT